MAQSTQFGTGDVGRLINLVPVGLKEAAIDSPTSRASIAHLAEQADHIEKWLEDYVRVTNRLVTESLTLETILNNFTSHAFLPANISETMLDHDYSVLAMKKYAEGAKDYWMSMFAVIRRMSTLVVEPIKHFLQNDLKAFKEARRSLEASQKTFDNLQLKYAALGKSKEASSLREDAFQLHEARKVYLKATMDFFTLAPQLRFSLDKVMVKLFFDQWKEMRVSRENTAVTLQKSAGDMERVKGWISEMENSEKVFRKELVAARKQLEEAAESATRPSRELDDYSISTVSQHGGHTHTASGATVLQKSPKKNSTKSAEKQGWLFLRTYIGKPSRSVFVRKWAFLRNGVFGFLLQSTRTSGVEESERIGVLLCNVRPAPNEERRFCFELKTNRNTIILQAETQSELADWISAFETAKSKALEDPGATDTLADASHSHDDPAFAISAPPVPEFGTFILSSTEPGTSADDSASGLDRTATLPIPGTEHNRDSSVDLPRRSTMIDENGPRDHASRIISKLDLHRKTSAMPQISPSPSSPSTQGGIASLIAASHGSMPVGPSLPLGVTTTLPEKPKHNFALALRDMPPSTLAPSTLANTPAATNYTRSAIVVTGERGLSSAHDKSGIPNGLLANMWGSSYSGFVNRLERADLKLNPTTRMAAQPSPLALPPASYSKPASPMRSGAIDQAAVSQLDLGPPRNALRSRSTSPTKRHRNTISFDEDAAKRVRAEFFVPNFPSFYPLQLKTQDAQFRLLFPSLRRDERLVMVFRASWNPNDQQDFPGRVYVTSRDIYFYSNHFGLVLTTTVSLSSIDEATAAPGRECDFLFLHLKEGGLDGSPTRITIKTFLEPLRILQKRMSFLIKNANMDEPLRFDEVVKVLLKMESEAPDRSPSLDSWEDVSPNTPAADIGAVRHRARGATIGAEFKTPVRVDRALQFNLPVQGESAAKFKLPAQPVNYKPAGNLQLAAEREFDVSPKALFHVMFGDKSAMWQLLQHERSARSLTQGPWINLGEGRLRRNFDFEAETVDVFGRSKVVKVRDYQIVDVNSDHLCYVITDKRTPWYLPYQNKYRLVSKVVITHVAKGKCKLAIFIRVEWLKPLWFMKTMLEHQGLIDLGLDSQDLADLVADQVRKLGAHSRTKKAIQIFGQVGLSTDSTRLQSDGTTQIIETRRTVKSRSMADLLLQGGGTAAQSAAGTILESLFNLISWLAKTCSANKFILVLLVISALYNTWHTSLDTSAWWQERNASKFMARLGVSPNNVMTKAVYISDLDDALTAAGRLPSRDTSSCYAVFSDEHRLDDINAPPVSSHNIGDQSKASNRMHHTRQRLGAYRHDLLVAMRVLNSVEKEMMLAEWESWVVNENRRCRQVDGLIGAVYNASESRDGNVGVKEWYDEYCVSCRDELGKLGVV